MLGCLVPSIQVEAENIRELFDIGIKFKDVVLPAHLQKGLRTEVEYKGANLDVDVNKINAEKYIKLFKRILLILFVILIVEHIN